MSEKLRATILAELAKHTGKWVPAAFIHHTADFTSSIDRFHNLITGIYKPAWSEYALSIVMKLSSPYEYKDEVVFLEDGRWLMTYSPRAGGLHLSDNKALIKCMDERVPLGVFKQLTDKTDRQHGSTYRVLGLGLITGYDANADVFVIESCDRAALEQVTSVIADEKARYEVQLYAQLTNEFRPFVEGESITRTVSAPRRDEAFRHIVLGAYDFTCAVCEMKFRLGNLFEATAAHIVPKRKSGTDDPRNGLALCRTHHWAFDVGLFSLSDDYEVILSPVLNQADARNFTLLDLGNRSMLLPRNEVVQPHPKALSWHRTEVLLK
jgi:hypothetical protein